MPLICYQSKRISADRVGVIDECNRIIEAYKAQGFTLTLRQLYYQLVSEDLIPNNMKSYNRLKSIVSDGRMAGLIDWSAIEDRTRNLEYNPKWDSPAEVVIAAARQFRYDKWVDQEYRPEIWVEKQALESVVDRIASELQVPYIACKGYMSQSEMWEAGQRMLRHHESNQQPFIIHLGDHDPSGIDMSRDIQDRLNNFMWHHDDLAELGFKRIALNMDQITTYNPPPNPAKTTDSRYDAYIKVHGYESWELDALRPQTLMDLIRDAVEDLRDDELWEAQIEREKKAKAALWFAVNNWNRIEAISVDGDWEVEPPEDEDEDEES